MAEVAIAGPGPPGPPHLADRDTLTRRVAKLAVTADGAETFGPLSDDVTSYRRDVALLGLTDGQ